MILITNHDLILTANFNLILVVTNTNSFYCFFFMHILEIHPH